MPIKILTIKEWKDLGLPTNTLNISFKSYLSYTSLKPKKKLKINTYFKKRRNNNGK